MAIAEELVLIAVDPIKRRSLLGSGAADAVVGGAVLVDLVVAERCEVDGPAKKARVHTTSTTPLGSPVHDRALSRLKVGQRQPASRLVPRLGKGAHAGVLAALVAEGELVATRHQRLGFLTVTRYDIPDPARRDALLAEVRRVLVGEVEPDERTGPLVGLASAGDLVKHLVPGEQRKAATRRAKAIAKGDWAGTAAAAAVAAASAAATAAATAAIVAASAAGDGGGGSA